MNGNNILPDTNILILGLAGQEPYASFLRTHIEQGNIVFSAIVVAEFLSGARPREVESMDLLLRRFTVLPVDVIVARTGAAYRKKFKRVKTLKLPDCLIAATCKVHSIPLATMDRRDFPMKDIEVISDFG